MSNPRTPTEWPMIVFMSILAVIVAATCLGMTWMITSR